MTDGKGTKSSAKPKMKPSAAFTAMAEEALDTMETASRETLEATSKAGKESISEVYDKAAAFGTSTVEKSMETYESMMAEGKKNLEAMTVASAAVISGLTACNSKMVAGLKGGMKFNMECFEKLSSAEAPQAFAAIQVKAAADAIDLAADKAMEIGKIMTETYAQAYVPLKNRFDQSVSTFVKSMA
jgi:hypothetical protein